MPRPALQPAQNGAGELDIPPTPAATRAVEAADAFDSPARRLQQELEWAMAGVERGEPRWSARRSLAFMLTSNLVLWAGAIWALRAVL